MLLFTSLDSALQDFRYSARGLRQNPGFALTVVAMLALGIGANTTIFSVVRAVMLKPLPYKEPGRLVRLWESSPARGSLEFAVSAPNFKDWQSRQSVFEEVAALELATFNLTGTGEPERIPAASITANLIPALGVMPAIGRSFLPEEETTGHNRVVILSHSLWQRQFGADPTMPGKSIQLNGRSYTVVGIMPPDFGFGGSRELWVPLVLDPATEPWRADRTNHNLSVYGRLKSGVTVDQAAAEMNIVAERLEEQYPESNAGWGVLQRTFYDWIVPEQVRRSISVLFLAVALVLLIACANVANLLLARANRRQQEMAVRSALGASRARIVRQLLIESLMLSVLGGLAGLLLTMWATGQWSVAGGQWSVAGGQWPRVVETRVDTQVLAFMLAVSVATGLIFGLAPAWRASRVDLNQKLNETGRSDTGGVAGRLRSTLVVGEVALALALLVSAGLMMRSFARLQSVPLGFVPDHVLTMQISLPESRYSGREARVNFFDQLLERLRGVPGVVDAAATTHPPASAATWAMEVSIEGRPQAADKSASSADARAVTPEYFSTMGIPLLRGREFIKGDVGDKLIVSDTFARRYWPGEDPVGKRFRPAASNQAGTVVGVVGDVRDNNLQEEARPTFYFLLRPHRDAGPGSSSANGGAASDFRGRAGRCSTGSFSGGSGRRSAGAAAGGARRCSA